MENLDFGQYLDKKEAIAIIGLGYVGLPLACLLAKKFKVIGFDISEQRIKELRKGFDRTNEVSDKKSLLKEHLHYTSDAKDLEKSSFIIVTVPTPVDKFKKPDLGPLYAASQTVGEHLQKNSLVVFESTVFPGCTENECREVIEKHSGLKYGEDFQLGYSPERVNPGDKVNTIDTITKIISTSSKDTLDFLEQIYGAVFTGGLYKAPNIKTAEAAKVIENIQRDINVALVNELALIFDRCGIETSEVLKAAGTKWNFLNFHPGLVGGHCYNSHHTITLTNSGHNKIRSFEDYWEELLEKKKGRLFKVRETEIIKPNEEIKTLSFDKKKGESTFSKVLCFSKNYNKQGFRITTSGNHVLEVTDKHPVAIDEDGEWFVKLADTLEVGERIPLLKSLPLREGLRDKVDLIKEIPSSWHNRYRVKLKTGKWKDYKETLNIKKNTGHRDSNFYEWDYLPLSIFLELEKNRSVPVERSELLLLSGRGGGSFQAIPAVLNLDESFARLLGYYLSEGCITHDSSSRVRFTFHREETETIKDCCSLLEKIGLKQFSIYQDKTFQATTIKASSELLAFVLEKVLSCGVRSEDANIPEEFLYASDAIRWNVLTGLLRGDGGVSSRTEKRPYTKNSKEYSHRNVCALINYFSISPKLSHGIELLLMSFHINFSKEAGRPGLIIIQGTENLEKLRSCFLDGKRKKLDKYFQDKTRRPKSKVYRDFQGYSTAAIRKIEPIKLETVYSMEVEGTHAVVTDSGVISHNCIGVDPYYLTYMAEGLGLNSQLVLSGRRINDSMGPFVAEKALKLVMNGASTLNRPLKFIVAGLSFKENVPDLRNSKVIDVIEKLEDFGAEVYCTDPICDPFEFEEIYKRSLTPWEELPVCDAMILAVKHKKFEDLTLYDIERKLNPENKVLLDIKGLFDKQLAKSLGIKVWSL